MQVRKLAILLNLLIYFGASGQGRFYQLPDGCTPDDILNHQVVIKLLPAQENSRTESQQLTLDALMELPNVVAAESIRKTQLTGRSGPSTLDGIIKVDLAGADPISVCNRLLQYQNVLYAEPIFKEALFLVPNDPSATPGNNQSYLSVIRAYEAWDVTQGDPEIFIGVVDSGADLDHEDLEADFYENDDPINGIDDDGNGYIDDFIGYDFADNDNDAQADGNEHGTQVGGLAAASTDNGIGIAGLGFKSKLSPLKGFTTAQNSSTGTYEAVQYAADNDYPVINLSWGSVNSFSQFNQDIINYAVLEKDVVVVAAGGNTDDDLTFYPAGYEHVLSVAATNLDGSKPTAATYNYSIDVNAPGVAIYSTLNGDRYGGAPGSSFSAPMVAGVAALVRARFPNLNARQVMQRIRVTADESIYDIPSNEAFIGKLGKGRLDAFKAVAAENLSAIRAENIDLSTTTGDEFFFGDTVSLQFDLVNYLDPIFQPTVNISSGSSYLQFLEDNIITSNMNTLESQQVTGLKFLLARETPPGTLIDIRMDFASEDYQDLQLFSLTTSPDYVNIGADFQTTVAGNGSLGYASNNLLDGIGLTWSGENILDHIGLIVGTGIDQVSDNVVTNFTTNTRDQNFSVEHFIRKYPSPASSEFAFSRYNDDIAGSPLGIVVEQSVLSWSDQPDVLALQYRLSNKSSDTLFSLHIGLFTDWNLTNFRANRATWDTNNTGYVFHEQEDLYAASRLVGYNSEDIRYSAIDLKNDQGNLADFLGLFEDEEKFEFISSQQYDSAGFFGTGNDVASVLGLKIDTLPPGMSLTIPFILGASVNLPSLLTKLDDAEGALLDFSQEPFFDETFFSCEGGVVDINPASGAQFEFYSDRAGSQLIGSGDSLQIGPLDSDTVIYISNIDDGYNQTIRAVSVEILEEIASFELSLDTLYLGDEPVNKVEFEDKSFAPLSWYWDFGNGSEASVQHPTMIYNTAGTYTISLTVQNAQGCEDTESKTLLVAERPLQPDFQNFSICWGELVSFETTSMDTLRQYQSAFGDVVIQEGTPLIVGPITSDTSIFLTNSSGPFESKITVVNITLHSTDASFQYTPAIDSSATDYAWFTHDSPQTIQTGWFVNGIQQSTDDTLTLLVDESQYTIKLVTESATGCLDSLEQVIRFSPSPTPQIPDLSVCENEAVVISPSNGTYFGFYQDEELSALIQKGSAVEISNITSDTSLFIVGLDSILPSPPIAVNINLVSFHANIQAQPSTLLLNERRDVVFNVNIAAQEYRWYIDGAIKATIAEPRFFFDSAGTHEIVLEAFDEHNCQSFDTLTYEVLEEAPLGFGHDDEWKIFPNPVTDGVVHIQSKSKILKLEFVDMAGRIVLQKTQNIVEFSDVSSLYRGTYLLRLQFDSGDLYTQKIVIQ